MSGDTPTHEGYWMRVHTFGDAVIETAEWVYDDDGPLVYDEHEANGSRHVRAASTAVWLGPLIVDTGEVARLRAEVDRLTPDETVGVSDHLRARVREAGQACLDGEAGCTAKGCITGHQAGDLLDAYDDARADVDRLTAERGVSAARLTECQGLLASEREASANIAAGLEQASAQLEAHDALAEVEIAQLTRERDVYLAALARVYLVADPMCPANDDGTGEWAIEDVTDAVDELATEHAAAIAYRNKATREAATYRRERDVARREVDVLARVVLIPCSWQNEGECDLYERGEPGSTGEVTYPNPNSALWARSKREEQAEQGAGSTDPDPPVIAAMFMVIFAVIFAGAWVVLVGPP